MIISRPFINPVISSNPIIVTSPQVLNPIVWNNPILNQAYIAPNTKPVYVTSIYQPTFYTDSGIGENPMAVNDVVIETRFKFLDKWLYKYSELIQMLKVVNGNVKVLKENDAKNNDISKDSKSDLEAKSDYIGDNILTLSKCRKVLDAFCEKNYYKFYDIPHQSRHIKKELFKYVKAKLQEE